MTDKNSALDIAKNVIKYTSPITFLLMEATEKAIKKTNSISEQGNFEEIQNESLKQELLSKIAEDQAKVAQELAIARRIDTAEEVTIEEFYDTDIEGSAGINAKEGNVSLGLSGSHRKVTKRIYTFKGWRDGGLEITSINEK